MKSRMRKALNFVAINVLFFALYLNFIHKDKAIPDFSFPENHSELVSSNTIPVTNPSKYLGQIDKRQHTLMIKKNH
ncbi:MAG TPA: hypothetical protein VIQ00_02395 [Chitinophagaceae bacterium]|jgi:hypothetical protein